MTDTEEDDLFQLAHEAIASLDDTLVADLKLKLDKLGHPAAARLDLYASLNKNFPVVRDVYKEMARNRYLRGRS